MDRQEAIVHETGKVGELLIENRGDLDLFVQVGDIVKGGRQDRVIGVDLIVERGSGPTPIPSFCVEQGRWAKRGKESDHQFSSSASSVASKAIRFSAKISSSQGDVWNSIAKEQVKLSQSIQAPVTSAASSSSYQLTLENEKLRKQTKRGIDKLFPLLDQSPDALGWVYSINGELNSADVYANHDLFKQLWEKLFSAAITEAIGESTAQTVGKRTVDDVKMFLAKTAMDLSRRDEISPRVSVLQYQRKKTARFETQDRKFSSTCVHTNVLSIPG